MNSADALGRPGKVGFSPVAKVDALHRKGPGVDAQAALRSREQAVAAREAAVHLREKAAESRERDILAAKGFRAASVKHRLILQQANTRLVLANLEAQQLTERLEATQIALERAKCLAENSNRAKSEFISGMGHELRAPLNAILGFAQLIELGPPPLTPLQSANIAQILRAGWYLLNLVNKTLEDAVIESGHLPVSREPVLLMDVIRECQAIVEIKAQARDIQVTVFPFDSSWVVMADTTRVKQVVINLLTNAVKYNRDHGTLEVRCTACSPAHLRISVKDSGSGLSAEKLTHLFEPFNRLGQEAGTEEGTGIGLVVCKQLVELMGGTLGVQSTVGVGSEFWIDLMQERRHEPR